MGASGRSPAAVNGASACLMIAAFGLLAAGAIGPFHALVLAGAILYGRWRVKPLIPPLLWDALAVGALVLFPFDLFVFSRDLIGAALRLLSFVVIYRCTNLPGPRELRQAVSLSFVQVLAAAASTTEIHFFPVLAVYALLAVWTLMAMASTRDIAPAGLTARPAARPAAALTGSTLALGATLFFVIPHMGTGYLQRASIAGEGLTGFADRIELGSINRIKKNRAIVMRVRIETGSPQAMEPDELPLRWRGMALDSFDGRSWSLGLPEMKRAPIDADGSFTLGAGPGGDEAFLDQEIILEPLLSRVLFAAPGAFRIGGEGLSWVGTDAGATIYLGTPSPERLTYRVSSWMPSAALAGFGLLSASARQEEMTRFLVLPRLDSRVAELARSIVLGAATDLERARRIEEQLRTQYRYTLDVNDAGVADPVSHFLIERHPGHCEYFATAMAVLLRHIGIPSRVVNGFTAGEWSDLTRAFIVRQSDAHSWVEAWIPQRGWITFDPTPSGAAIDSSSGLLAAVVRKFQRIEVLWDTYIIGLDLMDQKTVIAVTFGAAARAAATAGETVLRLAGRLGLLFSSARGGLVGTLCLVLLIVAATRPAIGRIASRSLRRLRRGSRDASPASAMLRRFEARWAARGIHRAPGQTPLEFAREIERRAGGCSRREVEFIQAYYRARFQP